MSFHDLLWVLSVWELLNYDGSWYNNDLSSISCGYFNIQQQRKVHFSLSGEENRSSVSGRINVHQVNISDSGTESSESCGPRVDLKDQLGTIKKKKTLLLFVTGLFFGKRLKHFWTARRKDEEEEEEVW